MKYKGVVAILSSVATLILLIIILLPLSKAATSEEVPTTVSVSNYVPNFTAIICGCTGGTCSESGPTSLTPTAAANTTIYCYSTISDLNGFADIDQNGFNATFFFDQDGKDGADDLNIRYSNGTASSQGTDCDWGTGSGNSILVNCTFLTRYFINASTDSYNWTMNFTVNDSQGTANSTDLSDYVVNSVIGLDVKNASIDFGSMALGTNSSTSTPDTNITNTGNSRIDVKVNETAMTPGYLNCTSGAITTNATDQGIKFNLSTGFEWFEGLENPGLASDPTTIGDFDLPSHDASGTTDGEITKNVYWSILIPTSGVAGTCNGNTTITAVAG